MGRTLLVACLLAVTLPVLAVSPPASFGSTYVDGEVLVRFRSATPTGARGRTHARTGARTVRRMTTVEGLELVRLPQGTTVEQAVAAYRNDPDVLYAEPNFLLHALDVPNDPMFGQLRGLHNANDADIDAPEAWDITTGSDDVVVAVLDSGIDYDHPDLVANVWRNEVDCDGDDVDDDANGWVDDCHGIDTIDDDGDPDDDNNHGTHVAGTIGAVGDNGLGVVGVSRHVRLMACKFLGAGGTGSTANAIQCLEYVAAMRARGVNVVATNNSWGGGAVSVALYDAIAQHVTANILFVAAAGNDGSDANVHLHLPASYFLPNVVSVAATDASDARASFSNYGRHTVHLGAPGNEIVSTIPGGVYGSLSGTSMAAPHVTGVVALLAAQDPGRSWHALRNLVLSATDPRPSMALTVTGGRLNAHAALTCSGHVVQSRLRPVGAVAAAALNSPAQLAVLHAECANPAGELTVVASDGGPDVVLRDDGANGDQFAGDGVYTGQWTPTAVGTVTLTFPGGDTLEAQVTDDLLTSPDPIAGGRFGAAMAAVPGGLAIGAPGTAGSGAVYVTDPLTGVTIRTIGNPSPAVGDRFGSAVAYGDGLLIVGAPYDDAGAQDSGAVHVFDATTGALLRSIPNPNPHEGALFGHAVAVVAGNVAVGAPFHDGSQKWEGVAYLFAGSDGTLLHTFSGPSGEQLRFGWTFAKHGSRLLIGAPGVDFSIGRVFMFEANAAWPSLGGLIHTFEFVGSTPAPSMFFGHAVAVAGSFVVVSDPLGFDPRGGSRPLGLVQVFSLLNGQAVREIHIPWDRAGVLNSFGEAVVAVGDDVVVGAPQAFYPHDRDGMAFRFDAATGALVEAYVRPPVGFGARFGESLVVTDTGIFIGAPDDDIAGLKAGAVYEAIPIELTLPRLETDRRCYKGTLERGDARMTTTNFMIEDKLESRLVVAGKIDGLCPAAVSDAGAPTTEPWAQLRCRAIKSPGGTDPPPIQPEFEVTTALGSHVIKLRKPKSLCVPASFEDETASTTTPSMKCYVASTRGRGPAPVTMTVTDELGTRTVSVQGKVRTWCTRAVVDGKTRVDAANDLVCYGLKPTPGSPRFARQVVTTWTPMDTPRDVDVIKDETICLRAQSTN